MENYEFLQTVKPEPGNLIRGLQLIQSRLKYIPDDAIVAAGQYFGIPAVEVEGVVSFYAQFKRVKPGLHQIAACDGTACHIKGASQVLSWIQQELGISDGQTTSDGVFSLTTVACLGCCSLAPVISIDGRVYGKLDRRKLNEILKEYRNK